MQSFIFVALLSIIITPLLGNITQAFIDNKELFEVAANIATILGIPSGIAVYYLSKKREREQREFETYDRLDDRFIDYIKLCLDNPELNVFEVPLEDLPYTDKNQQERRKEIIIYTSLIAIFERYYLSYMRQKPGSKALLGWETYMEYWFTKDSFREAWDWISIRKQIERAGLPDNGKSYNAEFVDKMNELCHRMAAWKSQHNLKDG